MRLYMKQKMFSMKQDFDIYDADQAPVFHVDGKFFSLGQQLTIYDSKTQEALAEVKEKITWFTPTFNVFVGGRYMAQIKKKLTFFSNEYEINDLGWYIKGDVWGHDYDIYNQEGNPLAHINKKVFSWTDAYEFDIEDGEAHPVLVMAVILAIDAVMDDSED